MHEVTHHKCAGNHTAAEYIDTGKKYVNCIFKIQKYNLKISDKYDVLSQHIIVQYIKGHCRKRERKRTG